MSKASKSKPAAARKSATGKGRSRAELRKQLARDLAAVLSNPEIPAYLYNEITAAVTDFQSTCIDYDAMLYSAETIGKALEMYAEKGGVR